VFTSVGFGESPEFHADAGLTDEDVAWLTRHVRRLIVGHLQRRSCLDPDEGVTVDSLDDEDPLRALQAGSVRGVQAELFGTPRPAPASSAKKKLCADSGGFSLHAGVRVPAGRRDRLERLCRYVCRPPLAVDRVRLTADGMVAYSFRKPWKNGVEGVRLAPLTFLSRLAALIPPPRAHLLTYHGILAPGASGRELVVPELPEDELMATDECAHAPSAESPGPEAGVARPKQGGTRRRYYRWAELMKRVFGIEALVCDMCGGRRKVMTFLTDPRVVRGILEHLGLATELPAVAPARSPPRMELPYR
jgi:hypothetical protein